METFSKKYSRNHFISDQILASNGMAQNELYFNTGEYVKIDISDVIL